MTDIPPVPGTALLIIDMQVDFITGSLAVPGARDLIDTINEIIGLPFHYRVASKDFHPPGHVSFASTHRKNQFEETIIYPPKDLVGDETISERGLSQILWPDHCVQGSPGVEFISGLNVDGIPIVLKGDHSGVECYSAFKDPWGLKVTELQANLVSHGIEDVFLVGVAGDFCVKATAIDAVDAGFNTFVVRDGVRSVQPQGGFEEMEKAGVQIIDLAKLQKVMLPSSTEQ